MYRADAKKMPVRAASGAEYRFHRKLVLQLLHPGASVHDGKAKGKHLTDVRYKAGVRQFIL
jgi:hypothetical protein